MFAGLLAKFFLGGGLSAIGDQLNRAYANKLAAKTSEATLDAEQEIALLSAKRDVLLAEQGAGGLRAWIRPLFALPFVIYNAKLVLWDKVFGLGTTDALSPELFQIEMIVIGAYFLGRSAEKISRGIVRKP